MKRLIKPMAVTLAAGTVFLAACAAVKAVDAALGGRTAEFGAYGLDHQ